MAGVKAGPAIAANVDPATVKGVGVGGYVCHADPVAFHDRLPVTTLKVRNTGDRPVQVGSHFHFFEVNRALEFDRAAAFGQHLNIPASTALRFEPGDEREVKLVPYGGKRAVYGFNNLVDGPTAGKAGADRKIEVRGAGREARLPLEAVTSGARAPHSTTTLSDPAHGQDLAQRVRRTVRPHDGRPHPAGRHRSLRRDRARPARRVRRRDRLRRRQEPARRHGDGQPAHACRHARPRHHQRDDHRRGAGRGEGRRRHQGRPDLRDRQGRQSADDGQRHAGPRVRPRHRCDLGQRT